MRGIRIVTGLAVLALLAGSGCCHWCDRWCNRAPAPAACAPACAPAATCVPCVPICCQPAGVVTRSAPGVPGQPVSAQGVPYTQCP